MKLSLLLLTTALLLSPPAESAQPNKTTTLESQLKALQDSNTITELNLILAQSMLVRKDIELLNSKLQAMFTTYNEKFNKACTFKSIPPSSCIFDGTQIRAKTPEEEGGKGKKKP